MNYLIAVKRSVLQANLGKNTTQSAEGLAEKIRLRLAKDDRLSELEVGR